MQSMRICAGFKNLEVRVLHAAAITLGSLQKSSRPAKGWKSLMRASLEIT